MSWFGKSGTAFATLPALLTAPVPAGAVPQPPAALVGRWSCAGYFVASGKPLASTIDVRRNTVPGTLLVRHTDRAPGTYVATELWSFASATEPARAAIVDSRTMRIFDSTGWKGAAVTWSRHDPDEQFVYTLDGASLRIDWFIARESAALALGDRLTCRRLRR